MSRRALVIAGLALLAAGLVLGLIPRHAAGQRCGSAFTPRGDAFVSDLLGHTRGAEASCDTARSALKTPAVAALAAGGVLLLAGLALRSRPQQP
jgi:hypothetical protein